MNPGNQVLEFDGFRVDLANRLFTRDGVEFPLTPKVFDLLALLVGSEGHLLEREALLRGVWPDTFVEEGNLTKSIHLLRKCLGEDAEGREYIQTVSKRGYRFTAKVRVAANGRTPVATASPGLPSIAVLVLEDMSALHDQEYFCEGMSEEIITRLMRLPSLRVASRTSSFQFRGRGMDVRQIGSALGVRYVLEGSVRKVGDRLRIVVQLVQTEDGFQVWSSRFDRRMEHVFEIQDEIASAVARVFELSLSSSRPGLLTRPATLDIEAYNLYLEGRYYWNKRPGEAVDKSLACFEKAIQRDDQFALAYVGVADVYNALGSWEFGVLPPREALSKAKSAARRALAIDPLLAEAHSSLAYTALHYDRDLAEARTLFENAIDLNPQYIHAHHWYSHCLTAMGRVEESLAASRLVLTMDPLHLLMNAHLGWHYFMADQPDPAVEQCDRLLRLERAFPWGHYFKGCALALRGDAVSSVDSFREALDLSGTPVMLAGLGYALAVNQESGPALEIAANLERQAAGLGLFAFEIGLIHFALHDLDRAFQYFRKAREELSGWSLYLPVDPRLKSLRSDPRFAELASGITQL